MKNVDLVRAWRDAEYRAQLDSEQRSSLPASPAGVVDLDDDALKSVTGGCGATACSCGLNTTRNDSCVTPPANCP